MTYNWTDNCCESGVAQCNTDVLNENLMHLKYDVPENIQTNVLNVLYPIGAIYIGTMQVCPLAILGVGTWQLKATDRVLQGSGVNSAGSTVEAGLPNITGAILDVGINYSETTSSSALYASQSSNNYGSTNSGTYKSNLNFNASNSNPIYGNSSTVQPPAYIVNIWERIS